MSRKAGQHQTAFIALVYKNNLFKKEM